MYPYNWVRHAIWLQRYLAHSEIRLNTKRSNYVIICSLGTGVKIITNADLKKLYDTILGIVMLSSCHFFSKLLQETCSWLGYGLSCECTFLRTMHLQLTSPFHLELIWISWFAWLQSYSQKCRYVHVFRRTLICYVSWGKRYNIMCSDLKGLMAREGELWPCEIACARTGFRQKVLRCDVVTSGGRAAITRMATSRYPRVLN